MALEGLCDRLRNGDAGAKKEARELYGELCSKPLDSLALKIIANSVADDEINRQTLHDTAEFWDQVPDHLESDQLAYIWAVVIFNLFNGSEITHHLDLVGEKVGKWLIDRPDSNSTSIYLELLLKSARYCESKSIPLKIGPSVLDNVVMSEDFESVNEMLELSARLIGLNPELENHLAGSETGVLQLLKSCKTIDDDNYAWAIGLLGTISYSSEFEKICNLSQTSNAIIQMLSQMINSDINGIVSIAGVVFGNLITDDNKGQIFISSQYVKIESFIQKCIRMTAVEKQAIHLLKNLSNNKNITSTYLIPNGIAELIGNVLSMKVFPRLKSTAATLAKNVLLTAFDGKLYGYLISLASSEEDTTVRNAMITAISMAQPDLVPDLNEHVKTLFMAHPPTTSSIKALTTFPASFLVESFEAELSALFENYDAIQDRGTQNNIAYLAAEIAKVNDASDQLIGNSRDILKRYIESNAQS